MKYEVDVTFRAHSVVEIEADSAEEATRIANEMIIDRDLLAEDLDTTEWIVDDAQPKHVTIQVKQFGAILPKKE